MEITVDGNRFEVESLEVTSDSGHALAIIKIGVLSAAGDDLFEDCLSKSPVVIEISDVTIVRVSR